MRRLPPSPTLFPTRRSSDLANNWSSEMPRASLQPFLEQRPNLTGLQCCVGLLDLDLLTPLVHLRSLHFDPRGFTRDRKSTRLNSSHPSISYAVFCLKKKNHR